MSDALFLISLAVCAGLSVFILVIHSAVVGALMLAVFIVLIAFTIKRLEK